VEERKKGISEIRCWVWNRKGRKEERKE